MHINNQLSAAQFGNGSKPDRAAHSSGKPQQFDIPTSETEPAATTNPATAVAPTEETEGPGKSGNSVAHRARAMRAMIGLRIEGRRRHVGSGSPGKPAPKERQLLPGRGADKPVPQII